MLIMPTLADFLLPILRVTTWLDIDPNYLMIVALDKIILEEARRV